MEENEEGGGDADSGGPSHRGMGKGLSREQRDGLDMVKHVMLSLDEEDGLDQIYTFRLNTDLFVSLFSGWRLVVACWCLGGGVPPPFVSFAVSWERVFSVCATHVG